ncbi:hypothetical protein LTR86_008806 [Recurvomyces mirabilis]|nr:hypothetical protein LTR86_008806 [Recurvomyces mirabilis]
MKTKMNYTLTLFLVILQWANSARTNHITPIPAPHPDVSNRADHAHLKPSGELQLHYHHLEHPASIHVASTLIPVINLLHTSHIEGLICNDTTASITFSDDASRDSALHHWQNALPFAVVHAFRACGNSKATHGWLIVNSINSAALSARSTDYSTISTNVRQSSYADVVGPNTNATLSFGQSRSRNQGLPSAFDASFDEALDRSYGPSTTLFESKNQRQLMPRSRRVAVSQNDDVPHQPTARSLHRRKDNILTKLKDEFAKIRNSVVEWAETKNEQQTMSAADITLRKLDEAIQKLQHTSTNVHIDTSRLVNNTVEFMGQPAMLLDQHAHFQAYCVGCRLEGDFTIDDGIVFSIADGITSSSLSVRSSNLKVIAQLGLELLGPYHKEWSAPIFARQLSGDLMLPYVSLGPIAGYGIYYEATISVTVDVSESSKAQLLIGAELEWPELEISGNLASERSVEASGLEPNIKEVKKFESKLDLNITALVEHKIGIQAEVKLGKPTGADVGVYIGPGFQVGIEHDTPSRDCPNGFELSRHMLARGGFVAKLDAVVTNKRAADHRDWSGLTKTTCLGIKQPGSVENKDSNSSGGNQDGLAQGQARTAPRHDLETGTRTVEDTQTAPNDAGSSQSKRSRLTDDSEHEERTAFDRKGPLPLDVRSTRSTKSAENGHKEGTFAPSVIDGQEQRVSIRVAGQSLYVVSVNGTLYLDRLRNKASLPAAASFQTIFTSNTVSSQLVVADHAGLISHAYSNEFSSYGVSRVRCHPVDRSPASSLVIAFGVAIDISRNRLQVAAAYDPAGDAFAPMVCIYKSR